MDAPVRGELERTRRRDGPGIAETADDPGHEQEGHGNDPDEATASRSHDPGGVARPGAGVAALTACGTGVPAAFTVTTCTTKVRLASPTRPVTSQQPGVGKINPDGVKPLAP